MICNHNPLSRQAVTDAGWFAYLKVRAEAGVFAPARLFWRPWGCPIAPTIMKGRAFLCTSWTKSGFGRGERALQISAELRSNLGAGKSDSLAPG